MRGGRDRKSVTSSPEIHEEMLTSPLNFQSEWEAIARDHPMIAARFHDVIINIPDVDLPEEYYRATALYLSESGTITKHVPPDLLAAIGSEALRRGHNYETERMLIRHHLKFFRDSDWRKKVPRYPVDADAAMYLLEQMSNYYAKLIENVRIKNSDQLLDFMVTLLQGIDATGEEGYRRGALTTAKASLARKVILKHIHLVDDPQRFFGLGLDWVNQAVFKSLDDATKTLVAQERNLAQMPLLGVPLCIYARVHVGPEHEGWILQSPHWGIRDKAMYLNSTGKYYCWGEQVLKHVSGSTKGPGLPGGSTKGPGLPGLSWVYSSRYDSRTYTRDQGIDRALLFPVEQQLDFIDTLNTVGIVKLAGYLVEAPLKIKVKLTPLHEDILIQLVETATRLPKKKKEHILKHIV